MSEWSNNNPVYNSIFSDYYALLTKQKIHSQASSRTASELISTRDGY